MAGALGLGPSFAAPPDPEHHCVSNFMGVAVAPNRRTGRRHACHGVADAERHGCTDGALGIGLSLPVPGKNYLGGSTFAVSGSGATGLRRRRVAVRALDLGEDGEGEEDLPDEFRYILLSTECH
jgi:hypothetical protein